jgi:cyclase
MRYAKTVILGVFASLRLSAVPTFGAADAVRLAEGVYARIVEPDSEAVSNAGFVVLEDGVLVFDTHATPAAGEALRAEIRAATTRPVRYVVNSHFHPDHTHGNQAFAGASVEIIASPATRRDVLQRDIPAMNRSLSVAQSQIERLRKDLPAAKALADQTALRDQIGQRQKFIDRLAGLRIVPPLVALENRLDVVTGPRTVRLLSLGKGHTEGDIVALVPDARVAFVGDLFFNAALPAAQDAFLLEWSATLGHLLALDVDTFVPGHGPAGTKEDVRRFRRYLDDLKALVEASVSKGLSMEATVRDTRVPSEYASFRFQSFFPANVQKMFTELKALEPPPAPEPAKKASPAKP